MGQAEWILYLAASTLYAISSILYIYCLVFRKEERIKYAVTGAIIGLLLHSASIALRWIETGHGPYLNMYEALSSFAWFCVPIFLLAQHKYDRIKIAGAVVLPAVFLIMGVGMAYSRDIRELPPALQSYWLIAHVGFAKLAFGSILVAVALAVLYISRDRRGGLDSKDKGLLNGILPDLRAMDDLMYRFVASGFLFLTIMISTGAIWANQTWGRYWGWDPTETWSLVTWFVYGIILHLRKNAKWNGRRVAWLIILSIFVLAFSLFGVGYLYRGLHTGYLIK